MKNHPRSRRFDYIDALKGFKRSEREISRSLLSACQTPISRLERSTAERSEHNVPPACDVVQNDEVVHVALPSFTKDYTYVFRLLDAELRVVDSLKTAFVNSRRLQLSDRETTILLMLARRRSLVVSMSELLDAIYVDSKPVYAEVMLRQSISNIRRLMHDADKLASFITTVRGRGFYLQGFSHVM